MTRAVARCGKIRVRILSDVDLFLPRFDLEPYRYAGDRLTEVAFPLGGVGAGCVSLEGRGALSDWEIFGRPNKGPILPNAFPTLWCQTEGSAPDVRVVHGPRRTMFLGSGPGYGGYGSGALGQGGGLPHFRENRFFGTFPIARIEFEHPSHPLDVRLAAFSPFIPLASRDSGMPIAALIYRLTNRTSQAVRAVLASSLQNPVGFAYKPERVDDSASQTEDSAWARFVEEPNLRGIVFGNDRFAEGHPAAGNFAIATDWPDVGHCPRWYEGTWFDSLQDFWGTFSRDGSLNGRAPNPPGKRGTASLGLRATIAPGDSVDLPFVVAWCFPWAERYWDRTDPVPETWRRWYAGQWSTAWDAASEFLSRREELTRRTLAFEHALHSSTLPKDVVESVAATTSILRTPTVDRLEDGTFWAWEGCHVDAGCCPGSCSHVWNYALCHAHLMPDLQASMLDSHFEYGFNCGLSGEKGAMNFRLALPLSQGSPLWHAASDGQMGLLVQAYRDWRLSGDRDALIKRWPAMKRALAYAWVAWDTDRDGLVDGDQHNTYDINFQGPNPLSQFFYLAALRACEEVGRELEDSPFADECRRIFESGSRLTVDRLWNGEYFVQDLDVSAPDAPKYQHGSGCLSDQVFGQLAATLAGLGDLVPPELVRASLGAVFRYNFRAPIGDHPNLQRVYALSDESGLLLCSWTRGGRPRFPFVYSDEVWTGVEYQVATHLALAGMEQEARHIVSAVRHRYDGRRRNPYNEVECGSHYARALAGYGLLIALSGVRIDLAAKEIRVRRRAEPGRYLFVCPSAWGTISVPATGSPDRIQIHLEEGRLPGGVQVVETDV